MSAHTPGPWGMSTATTSSGICHKIGPFPWKNGKQNHACIYVDYPGNGSIEAELMANARLIAAAPDLLEVAQEALAVIDRIKPTENGNGTQVRLRAAITKATQP